MQQENKQYTKRKTEISKKERRGKPTETVTGKALKQERKQKEGKSKQVKDETIIP